jgi:gas vesicle protein
MAKSTGKFFMAGVIGAIAGAVGSLLMAPKSGKETREDIMNLAMEISNRIKTETTETKTRVKEVFGKVTEEATMKYDEIKNTVVGKVAAVKTAGEEINKEKYVKIVDDVVAEFKGDLDATKTGAVRIAAYLKKDWEKMKKALV